MDEKLVVCHTDTPEWNASEQYPSLRWKYLVDSTKINSYGLSCGILEIATGGELPLHHHSPQEIYIIRSGAGLLLQKTGKARTVGVDDVVYIPEDEQHGIRNTGNAPLELLWIFPANCWEEVKYFLCTEVDA